MAQRWFPFSKFHPGSVYEFQVPTATQWKIDDKLSQGQNQREKADSRHPASNPSSAATTFRVQGLGRNGRVAYMRVILRIPHLETEYESPDIRRQQATLCHSGELEAYKKFHAQNAEMTPSLLAIKEEAQKNDGFVPGGFVVLVVYEKVPGIRLAEDDTCYPGLPLHTFFTKFNRAERDKIREKFNEVYPAFAEMDHYPFTTWAHHLVWDSSSARL